MAILAFNMLPLGLHEFGMPGPDILIALTFAWLLRQPNVVPVTSIIIVFLLADFLLQRPPGLWTILMIIVSENLRRYRLSVTVMPFLIEWVSFGVAVMTMLLLNRFVLWILAVDLDSLGLTLLHGIATIMLYPIVVLVSRFVLGLRKMTVSEI
jgi:rod shape-determining protein MreD